MRLRTIALAPGALITATLLLAGCAQNNTDGGMPGMDHGTTPMTAPSAGIGDFNSADEIETMTSWLAEWGIPYDDAMPEGMGGMYHGDGMMSEADMTALGSATGADATRLFLEGMIVHHQGAVQMARSVIDNGQTAEIATMQDILGAL